MKSAKFSIGITGGIACGKSEVGRILQSLDVAVCDADHVAHDLMKPGTSVYTQIRTEFGDGIIAADGTFDRAAMGSLVFNDPAALETLNGMVHPAVCNAVKGWLDQQEGVCAALVPLLYEVKWESMWDAVVCVAASEQNMLTRLNGRGFSDEEGAQRIGAQMSVDEKIARADYKIFNNGTLAELRKSTLRAMDRIRCERMQ